MARRKIEEAPLIKVNNYKATTNNVRDHRLVSWFCLIHSHQQLKTDETFHFLFT